MRSDVMPSCYYTVRIPWVPAAHATEWHPTTNVGPFSTLDRGAHHTVEAAIGWARDHLNGTPYTIVDFPMPEVAEGCGYCGASEPYSMDLWEGQDWPRCPSCKGC